MDTINKIMFQLTYLHPVEGMPTTPDIRTTHTLMEIPEAHKALEQIYSQYKIDILQYNLEHYLPNQQEK
jgi:hypothetical protein